ncbi:unnamed protein product [Pylaiella littoralis]
MAMFGGGGAYGGPSAYNHNNGHPNHHSHGSNGAHAHGSTNGGHHYTQSSGNGMGMGIGIGTGPHEYDDADDEGEEGKRETARLKEVWTVLEDKYYDAAAIATEKQELLEMRAVARLEIEKGVRKMQEAHEQKLKVYRAKAKEIKAVLSVRDEEIKLRQQKAKNADEEMQKFLRHRQEIINQAKNQEREAILNEERARIQQEAAEASGGGGGGDGYSRDGRHSSGAAATAAANGGRSGAAGARDMGRRTQSSTGASFFGRNARQPTHAAAAGNDERRAEVGEGGSSRPGPPRANAQQPKEFKQIRQTCVEDTMNNFFGL